MQHPAPRRGGGGGGCLVRTSQFSAGLASSDREVAEGQRLRYRVFADELGACVPGGANGLDRDDLDPFCQHLVVRERRSGTLVGTYRILPADRARRAGGFYAEREFDLRQLRALRADTVEVGRACVHPDFRHGAVIALLWAALLRYLDACESRYVMGCASVGLGAGHDAAAAICGRLCEEHLGPAPGGMSAPRRTSARLARHLLAVYASAVLRAPRLGPGERRELAARFARAMLDVLEVPLHVRGTPPAGGTGAGSRQSRVLARHVRPQRGRR